MNMLKAITASSLALGLAGVASAATDLNVSGSTAFRSATVKAEITMLSFASNGTAATPTAVGVNAVPTSASVSTVHGWDSAGNEFYIRNHWTGSVAGTLDVSAGNALSYIPDATVTPLSGTANNIATGSDTDSAAPDVAMSDSQFADNAASIVSAGSLGITDAAVINNAGLVDGGTNASAVAVCTFQWVLGAYSGAAPSNWAATTTPYNLTQQHAAALISTGSLPLSVVTGNSADGTSFLFLVGRNEDSGTRVAYQAESLAGATTGAKAFGAGTVQWMLQQTGVAYPLGSYGHQFGTNATLYPSIAAVNSSTSIPAPTAGIVAFKKWPQTQIKTVEAGATSSTQTVGWLVNTIPSLTWNLSGHSGYNGGGDVVGVLRSPNPVTGLPVPTGAPSGYNSSSKAYFVSCLGTSDAQTLINNGGTALAYNGVPFNSVTYSSGTATEGLYSLFTFEHLYYRGSVLAGTAKTGADELADTLTTSTNLAPAGFNVSTLDAVRGLSAGALIK